jgi:hypothetical protein
MFTGATDEKPGFCSSGVDPGPVNGFHKELWLRPRPLSAFFVGSTDKQRLLGAYQDNRFLHSALPEL